MRLLVTVAAVALASPHGCCTVRHGAYTNTRTRDNQLVSRPVTLAEVAPPAETILVHNDDGLVRVALDGSSMTVIDTTPSAMTKDGSIRIHVIAGTYVLRSDRGERVIADLVVGNGGFSMSPDDRFVAVMTTVAPTSQLAVAESRLAIITLTDGAVRISPLAIDSFWGHRWADDGSAVFHHDSASDTWRRIDTATGAVTEDRPPIRSPDPDGSVDCAAKGFRLRVDIRGERQRIVMDPIATQANPEELSGVRPRLLAEAENLPPSKLRDNPARLAHLMVTKPCDHYMFDFGGWVYVGAVASGRIAPLIRGSDAR